MPPSNETGCVGCLIVSRLTTIYRRCRTRDVSAKVLIYDSQQTFLGQWKGEGKKGNLGRRYVTGNNSLNLKIKETTGKGRESTEMSENKVPSFYFFSCCISLPAALRPQKQLKFENNRPNTSS